MLNHDQLITRIIIEMMGQMGPIKRKWYNLDQQITHINISQGRLN